MGENERSANDTRRGSVHAIRHETLDDFDMQKKELVRLLESTHSDEQRQAIRKSLTQLQTQKGSPDRRASAPPSHTDVEGELHDHMMPRSAAAPPQRLVRASSLTGSSQRFNSPLQSFKDEDDDDDGDNGIDNDDGDDSGSDNGADSDHAFSSPETTVVGGARNSAGSEIRSQVPRIDFGGGGANSSSSLTTTPGFGMAATGAVDSGGEHACGGGGGSGATVSSGFSPVSGTGFAASVVSPDLMDVPRLKTPNSARPQSARWKPGTKDLRSIPENRAFIRPSSGVNAAPVVATPSASSFDSALSGGDGPQSQPAEGGIPDNFGARQRSSSSRAFQKKNGGAVVSSLAGQGAAAGGGGGKAVDRAVVVDGTAPTARDGGLAAPHLSPYSPPAPLSVSGTSSPHASSSSPHPYSSPLRASSSSSSSSWTAAATTTASLAASPVVAALARYSLEFPSSPPSSLSSPPTSNGTERELKWGSPVTRLEATCVDPAHLPAAALAAPDSAAAGSGAGGGGGRKTLLRSSCSPSGVREEGNAATYWSTTGGFPHVLRVHCNCNSNCNNGFPAHPTAHSPSPHSSSSSSSSSFFAPGQAIKRLTRLAVVAVGRPNITARVVRHRKIRHSPPSSSYLPSSSAGTAPQLPSMGDCTRAGILLGSSSCGDDRPRGGSREMGPDGRSSNTVVSWHQLTLFSDSSGSSTSKGNGMEPELFVVEFPKEIATNTTTADNDDVDDGGGRGEGLWVSCVDLCVGSADASFVLLMHLRLWGESHQEEQEGTRREHTTAAAADEVDTRAGR